MPDTPKKFYLTTPIYYVNARPHIGHAYSTIAADVIARRHRLLGNDTFFLTGTDEHGQKVQRSAEKAGVPPQQFADEVSATFQNLWKRMGILDDSLSKKDPLLHRDYIRTTEERHKRGVQFLFRRLWEKGFIYLDSYTGAYCVSDEAFVDLPAGTPCPDCGRPLEIVTEENFFFRLSRFQTDLIDLTKSGDLNITPEPVRNEVLRFIRGNIDSVMPEEPAPNGIEFLNPTYIPTPTQQKAIDDGLLGITKNGHFYVPNTLKDLSISRSSFTWGIPVPEEVQRAAGAKQNHVVYVWLDALANYITAIGYGSEDTADKARFEKYWPADVHLVGKEITRFHCVYWPAFLMAAGLPLPKSVVANGWLLFEESKMSKSRGNVVRTETILDAFGPLCPNVPLESSTNAVILSGARSAQSKDPEAAGPVDSSQTISATEPALAAPTKAQQDLFAADVLRYFLLREIPFGQDGSFSFDALITRYNADLANGYGNLVSRTLNLIQQNQAGIITRDEPPWLFPSRKSLVTQGKVQTLEDAYSGTATIVRAVHGLGLNAEEYLDNYRFDSFLSRISLCIGIVDTYLTAHAPWKLAKSSDPADRDRMNEALYVAAESIRVITAYLYPILPFATAAVWRQLGLGSIEEAAQSGELHNMRAWGHLQTGTKLGSLAPIFPRADKGLAQIMTDMENPTTPSAPAPATSEPTAEALNAVSPGTDQNAAPSVAPAVAPTITIDDFLKVDLRVAQIVVAERIPKADKLLRLEVDLGTERRQILSGIAEFYTPEELIGKRIAIIANLAPRKMRGLESHGMLLAASGEDHSSKPILATFSDEIALGSKIR